MQVKKSYMFQWPPSPFVEDEDTALANEHPVGESINSLKSEDQPAPSRGSVDQYPIIIDSDDLHELEKRKVKEQAKREQNTPDTSSSEDNAGPPTPPPIQRKEEKRSYYAADHNGSSPSPPHPTTGQSEPLNTPSSTRGRPQVNRIQTDMGGDLRAMASGNRRPPSPYSYSRTTTYPPSRNGFTPVAEKFLSPSQNMPFFASFEQQQQQQRQSPAGGSRIPSTLTPDKDNNSSNNRYDRPRSRRRDDTPIIKDGSRTTVDPQPQPDPRTSRTVGNAEDRRSLYEIPHRTGGDRLQPSPSHSRRPSKELSYGSSGEERAGKYRQEYSRRTNRDVKDSPHTSSAEDSSREQAWRKLHGLSEEQKRQRRRSSHRRERPVYVDLARDTRTESIPNSAISSAEARYYRHEHRERRQVNPVTPVSGDAGKAAMEDYFERAFRDNTNRKSHKLPSPRTSGSVAVSPAGSPPRTPRSDRHSKDYLDTTPTMPRPTQRSRPPSMHEGQIRDLKSHSSLLSAATAGAAIAASASSISPKSSGQSTDATSSNTTSKPASAPRSRGPSPIRGDVNPISGPPESPYAMRNTLTPTYDPRPISRGSVASGDYSFAPFQQYQQAYLHSHSHTQPHHPHLRALSYSGYDRNPPAGLSHPSSALPPSSPATSTATTFDSMPPQPRSARSSINTTEALSPLINTFGLPPCPRSRPTTGYNDWYTIKEQSDIDICPSCMSVVGNTRYRDLLIPSLPRPYKEPSVCAMGKPWIRVAFLQSIRQNLQDLNLVRVVAKLLKEFPSCAGGREEIKSWYQVYDPQTKELIPDFQACPTCVRVMDRVFPRVATILDKPKSRLAQERACCLHIDSKHFPSLIDHFEQAELRCRGRTYRSADVENLVKHVRRVARYRPCPRDTMLVSRVWHYLPDLPELTICEGCYDEVVLPVCDRPMARDITKVLKTVPARRGSDGDCAISCQLYSERMRKLFQEAVTYRDFAPFEEAVKTRVRAQQRLSEMNKLLTQDLKCGIDRRPELERNQGIWRQFE